MKTVFGTYEWANTTLNIISGCSHNCKYCFSKEMAIRFKRKTPDTWESESLNLDQYHRSIPHIKGIVMFPSTHDITPKNLCYTLPFLKKILEKNNNVLLVTKPHIECITQICENCKDHKDNILFRFTIGSKDDRVLSFWEPSAPLYRERKESLVYAFEHGFKTSVSCEPMLDNNVEALIADLQNYVTDAIWLGKMNFVLRRIRVNGFFDNETKKKAIELIDWQSNDNIIALYNRLSSNPKIKWKESIKKVVGLDVSLKTGCDV